MTDDSQRGVWAPWSDAVGEARQIWDGLWDALPNDQAIGELDRLLLAHPKLSRELPLLAELIWLTETADPDLWSTDEGNALMRLADVIVRNGSDLEARRHEGLTPLMLAAKRGNRTMVEFLIKRGAILEARDDSGQNVLHMAADGRDLHMMEQCLQAGLDPNLTDAEGKTPLHVLFDGSDSADSALAALLLSHGASVRARDDEGRTVLHLLAKESAYGSVADQDDSLRLFLRAGADPFLVDDDGNSPWSLAVERENDGFLSVVRQAAYGWVADPPPVPEGVNLSGVSDAVRDLMERTGREWPWCLKTFEAFHMAAATDNGTAMRRCLSEIGRRGDEILGHPLHTWRRGDELTPLQAASADGHIEVARAILDFDWCVDEKTPWCMRTPLFLAVEARHADIAALLLEHGADPNERQPRPEKKTDGGRVPITTALHEAASLGDARMVRLLLARGADPDARDWRGGTPLHTTAWVSFNEGEGPSEVVDALVEAGASLMAVNEFGQIPLAAASTAEARLTEEIMADGIVGQTLRQALIKHHMKANAQPLEDARRCLDVLKASDPEEEWRVGIILKSVRTEAGAGHDAGDVVLLCPRNNTDWENLMVVRPKPFDELREEMVEVVAKGHRCYDNLVLGVRGSAVVQVDDVCMARSEGT